MTSDDRSTSGPLLQMVELLVCDSLNNVAQASDRRYSDKIYCVCDNDANGPTRSPFTMSPRPPGRSSSRKRGTSPALQASGTIRTGLRPIYPSKGVMTVHTFSGTWVVPPLRGCWLPAFEDHRVETATGLEMHSVYCQGLLALFPNRCGIVARIAAHARVILALADNPLGARRLDAVRAHGGPRSPTRYKVQPQTPLFVPAVSSPKLRQIAAALRADPADLRTLEEWAAQSGHHQPKSCTRFRS